MLCRHGESLFDRITRAKRDGDLPPAARAHVAGMGCPHPTTPPGTVRVGTVTVRPRERFAVVIPEPPPSHQQSNGAITA